MNNYVQKLFNDTKESIDMEAIRIQDYILKNRDLLDIDINFRDNISEITKKLVPKFKKDWYNWKPAWDARPDEWLQLYKDIFDCNRCELDYNRQNRKKNKVSGVFFENAIPKPIMIIQENADPVAESSAWQKYNMTFGCPMSFGNSSIFFENMLAYTGVTKNQVYITSMVKCGYKKDEYDSDSLYKFTCRCRKHLENQIKLYKPVIIWAIGVRVFEDLKLWLQDTVENVHNELLWSFDSKNKYIYHTDNTILINTSNPYYIMKKEKEFWFLKKEMAMLDLLRYLIKNLEKKVIA